MQKVGWFRNKNQGKFHGRNKELKDGFELKNNYIKLKKLKLIKQNPKIIKIDAKLNKTQ